MSRKGAVKKRCSGPFAEQAEAAHTEEAQDTAVFYRAQGGLPYCSHVSKRIVFGDDGKQQYRHGIGQGIWEKDQRQSHTCEYPVDAQGSGGVIAVTSQLRRDGNGLHALQKIQHNTVGGKGKRHAEEAAVYRQHSAAARSLGAVQR